MLQILLLPAHLVDALVGVPAELVYQANEVGRVVAAVHDDVLGLVLELAEVGLGLLVAYRVVLLAVALGYHLLLVLGYQQTLLQVDHLDLEVLVLLLEARDELLGLQQLLPRAVAVHLTSGNIVFFFRRFG